MTFPFDTTIDPAWINDPLLQPPLAFSWDFGFFTEEIHSPSGVNIGQSPQPIGGTY